MAESLLLTDKFGRRISDLRISITDRCNYKCVYCRTGNEGALYGDLPFDDYLRMARVLVAMGITKIRLTGGEPLLRKGVVEFVRELANLQPEIYGTSDAPVRGAPPGERASDLRANDLRANDVRANDVRPDEGVRPSTHADPLDIALTTNGHL